MENRNELYEHTRSDKVKWLISFLLIFVLLAGLIGTWAYLLRDEIKEGDAQQELPASSEEETGGAVVMEGESNGVRLMSARILSSEYENYGVSPMAETAYTLTATLNPDGLWDNMVNFSVDWTDPTDDWAESKEAADYVQLSSYEAESGESISVSCLGEFGAQITITAMASADEDVTASCTVDYAQKVTGLSLSLGDVTSGVKTSASTWSFPVTWETGTNAEGEGGAAVINYTTSEAYTIAESFSLGVSCSLSFQSLTTNNGWQIANMVLNTDDSDNALLAEAILNGDDVYFDNTFFNTYVTPWGSEYSWSYSVWNAALSADYFNTLLALEDWEISPHFSILVSISLTGEHSNYMYNFTIYPEGVTYNPVLESVNLSDTGFIF